MHRTQWPHGEVTVFVEEEGYFQQDGKILRRMKEISFICFMIFYYGDAMSTDSNHDIKSYYRAWPLLDIVEASNKSTQAHIHIYILLG